MWNTPVNTSVGCSFFIFFIFLWKKQNCPTKAEKQTTLKATSSIPWAPFALCGSWWPVWTRSRCLQNQLFCFLSYYFFFLNPSLPSIPPLHTPCHSSADGRSDTWRMLGNQRDSWLPSRGELLHMLTHMYILQGPCVQAYGRIHTITCMDSAQNSPCFSAYADIFI